MPVTSLTASCSATNAAAASKSPQHVTMTPWKLSEIDERREGTGPRASATWRLLNSAQLSMSQSAKAAVVALRPHWIQSSAET